MDLQASDLPPAARRTLLDALRRQLGEARYHRVIDQIGEDGLLNTVIDGVLGPEPAPLEPALPGPGVLVGVVVGVVVALALIAAALSLLLTGMFY